MKAANKKSCLVHTNAIDTLYILKAQNTEDKKLKKRKGEKKMVNVDQDVMFINS